jgi:hypothetical protein
MKIRQILLTAAAAVLLTATGAMARDFERGPDRNNHPDHSWAERHDRDGAMERDGRGHDRYWRPEYRGFAGRDTYSRNLRAHNFHRWDGQPYWFHGRYVVRTYDRRGRAVFVEMNPYSGAFIGVVRF